MRAATSLMIASLMCLAVLEFYRHDREVRPITWFDAGDAQ